MTNLLNLAEYEFDSRKSYDITEKLNPCPLLGSSLTLVHINTIIRMV